MHQLFVLYEDATGYALFRTTEFEEIATFLPQVQDSIIDVSKFRSVVFLVAFQQFESLKEGLENAKCISNGVLHQTLQLFLENNVPRSKKSKQRIMLGVQDPTLASHISDTMGLNCSTSGAVFEIVRGIRIHFRKLLKAFHDETIINKTKLALSHNYSRDVLKIAPNKVDSMIHFGLGLLDQLKQNMILLVARIRKLYGCHFPELSKIVPDPHQYVLCVKEIGDRKNLPSDIKELLMSILENEDKVESILKSTESSMGMPICEVDIENINLLIDQVISLQRQEEGQTLYVKTKMQTIAPSLGNLMGDMAGAHLIRQAGSLTHLSKLPSSTIQILGAKKSLFRALKSKDAPVKFSSISKSSFIGQDGRISKGKMARFLANKCSLAARSDCYNPNPSGIHGTNMKLEVQNRLKFYEKGSKNPDLLKKKRRRRKKSSMKNRKLKVSEMEVER